MSTAASKRADLRVQRVIKCLRLLEHSCYSADDLAGHFGISKRTVYRDLNLLTGAGVTLAKRADDHRFFAPAEGWPAEGGPTNAG